MRSTLLKKKQIFGAILERYKQINCLPETYYFNISAGNCSAIPELTVLNFFS